MTAFLFHWYEIQSIYRNDINGSNHQTESWACAKIVVCYTEPIN